MDSAQSVTCAICSRRVALRDAETNSIAHFAEHMFFKGRSAAQQRATSPCRSTASAGSSTRSLGKEYSVYTQARGRAVTWPSMCSSICCSTRSSTPPRSTARRGRSSRRLACTTTRRATSSAACTRSSSTVTSRSAGTSSGEGDRPWREPARPLSATSTVVSSPRMVVGIGGKIEDDLAGRIEELLGDMEDSRDGPPRAGRGDAARRAQVRVHTKASDQAHICFGVTAIRSITRTGTRYRSSPRCSAAECRRALHARCATPRPRLLRLRLNHGYTDAGSLYAQAGVDINRIDDAVTTMQPSCSGSPRSPSRRGSSRKPGTSQRPASSSSSRARRE